MSISQFNGKVVIITGSGMGIGKTLAMELAKRGAKIVLNGRNKERLDNTEKALSEKGYDAISIIADVTNEEDCRKLIDITINHFGRIDMLINNAGLSMNGEIKNLSSVVFKKVMDTNYLGSVYPTLAALPYIQKTKGNILFMSSVAGISGFPKFSAYCASKMTLTAFAESLKIELAGTGVHVGINYVSFTYNEPEKIILGIDGNPVKKKELSKMKYYPREKVVSFIVRQLLNREYISNPTFYGKLVVYMKKFFPGLFRFIITKYYQKGKI